MDPINKSRTDPDPATEKPPTNQISIAPRAVRFEEFICDWMVKALGLIAAILFGIWAPLSYKATRDGDGSNAAAQASLMSAIGAVSSIQSSAASKQSNALSEIAAQYSAMGKLQAVQYCETYTNYAPCVTLLSQVYLPDLLSSLGDVTLPPTRGSLSATSSSRSSSTLQSGSTFQPSSAVPSPGSASSASGGSLVGIIIGVVIAVIVVVAALGYLAWRRVKAWKNKQSQA